MTIFTRLISRFLPAAIEPDEFAQEAKLLSNYSSDTIYRLRYSTMRYEYISPAVIKLLGFTPEEMRQIDLRSLILETRIIADGMKRLTSYEGLEAKRKRGETRRWQADYLMRTKEGNNIWVTDVSYPWVDNAGKVIGSIGSLRNITDRVKAEAKAREELTRMAHTDSLTALANRREFFRRMEHEAKRLKRTDGELSMLLIDIDHFKKVNDTYGHDIGDMLLAEIARIIHNAVRETDLPARVGGEEFAILLTDTPASGAYWVAERINKRIATHIFYADTMRKVPLHCTVSIGIAAKGLDGIQDASGYYREADTRLNLAKTMGRNQVSAIEQVAVH